MPKRDDIKKYQKDKMISQKTSFIKLINEKKNQIKRKRDHASTIQKQKRKHA